MGKNGLLPSVEELVNKTKNSTTQVCLRVKDSTKEFFEAQARIYSKKAEVEAEKNGKAKTEGKATITANALMVTLLDEFAANGVKNQGERFNFHGVREYMAQQAEIIGKAADDVLFHRLFDFIGCRHNYVVCHDNADQMYAEYCEILENPNLERDNIEITFNHGGDLCCHPVGAKAEVVAMNDADFGLDAQLYIPAEKWPIVAAMAHAFSVKVTGGNETACDLTLSVLEKLAEAINAHNDRAELAACVANVLADYAEQLDV